jgi:hypothetical protein
VRWVGFIRCRAVRVAAVGACSLLLASTLSLRASANQSPLTVREIASSLRSSQSQMGCRCRSNGATRAVGILRMTRRLVRAVASDPSLPSSQSGGGWRVLAQDDREGIAVRAPGARSEVAQQLTRQLLGVRMLPEQRPFILPQYILALND